MNSLYVTNSIPDWILKLLLCATGFPVPEWVLNWANHSQFLSWYFLLIISYILCLTFLDNCYILQFVILYYLFFSKKLIEITFKCLKLRCVKITVSTHKCVCLCVLVSMLENIIFLGSLNWICCFYGNSSVLGMCDIGHHVIKFRITVGCLFLSDLVLF